VEIVRELAKEHMVAFVAHTPELLDLADRVLVLDGPSLVSLCSGWSKDARGQATVRRYALDAPRGEASSRARRTS
jgi:hypothetical protein